MGNICCGAGGWVVHVVRVARLVQAIVCVGEHSVSHQGQVGEWHVLWGGWEGSASCGGRKEGGEL